MARGFLTSEYRRRRSHVRRCKRRAAAPDPYVRERRRQEGEISGETFAEYERDGWERNAGDYDEIDLPATGQAIDPLLKSLGDLKANDCLRSPRAQAIWQTRLSYGARRSWASMSRRMWSSWLVGSCLAPPFRKEMAKLSPSRTRRLMPWPDLLACCTWRSQRQPSEKSVRLHRMVWA